MTAATTAPYRPQPPPQHQNQDTLATGNLGVNRTRREQEELRRLSDLSVEQGGLTYDQRRIPAKTGPLLSAQLEGVFVPSEIEWRTVKEQQQDWLTVQNFWGLVQMNASTLRSLRLDRSLDSLAHLRATEFFFVTLAGLPKLQELDNALLQVGLTQVLERLPNVRSHRLSIFELHNHVLPKTYTHLCALEIYGPLSSITFFSLLGRLTNLEDLKVSEFVRREQFPNNPGPSYLNNTPVRLKRLHIMSGAANLGANLATHILPWVPLLTTFTIDRIEDGIAEALWTHCKHLDTILHSDDGHTLFEINYDRANRPTLPTSKLYKILNGFRGLKVMDRIDQRIAASDLIAQDWTFLNNNNSNNSNGPKLQVFRCQIVNIDRLTRTEEEVLVALTASASSSSSSSMPTRLNEGMSSDLVNKHTRSKKLQHQILSCLGMFTSLRVLDLGYEWRDVWAYTRSETPRTGFIPYSKPLEQTLELSLTTGGLTRLAGLKLLEVFGFEGVDHRIGKPELEWMAKSWPMLKVMRGLQEADLIRIKPDPVKTALRLFMLMLRPDVKHESLAGLRV
ncbi:hypothetical protein BGX24_012608 [Mortierella sp. AD032]|nr:hypothetical protein BGX24_012608 [Mortierella sp. AD032]